MNGTKGAGLERRPDILYKYRAATDRTMDVIATQSIWLSQPSGLNDPLECRTGFVDPKEVRALVKGMKNAAILGLAMRTQIYSLTPQETSRWVESISRKSHRKKYEAVREITRRHNVNLSRPENVVKAFQKRINATGILSLSADPQNELMWAHYADEHRGLALGFSSTQGTRLGSPETIPVVYSDDSRATIVNGFQQRAALTFTANGGQMWKSEIPFESDLFRAVVSTKPASWKYEREWRYVEPTHGLRPWPAPLVSVTFGARMKASERQKYREHIRSKVGDSVKFFAMRVTRENVLERHRLS